MYSYTLACFSKRIWFSSIFVNTISKCLANNSLRSNTVFEDDGSTDLFGSSDAMVKHVLDVCLYNKLYVCTLVIFERST